MSDVVSSGLEPRTDLMSARRDARVASPAGAWPWFPWRLRDAVSGT